MQIYVCEDVSWNISKFSKYQILTLPYFFYKHRGTLFVFFDTLTRSMTKTTITTRFVPKFYTYRRPEWPEIFFLDLIHEKKKKIEKHFLQTKILRKSFGRTFSKKEEERK